MTYEIEHDDDLHERWHNSRHPRHISMSQLLIQCPACAAEAADDEAAELAAIIADETDA